MSAINLESDSNEQISNINLGGFSENAGTQTLTVSDEDGNEFEIDISDDYIPTRKKSFSTQQQVADAWERMEYPTHNYHPARQTVGLYSLSTARGSGGLWGRSRGQKSESVKNYRAFQFPDGHGRITHYQTICAIRTRSGMVINNEQNWASGFAKVVAPDSDARLCLTGMQNLLGREETLYDISHVIQQTREIATWNGKTRTVADNDIKIAVLASGDAIVQMRDETAAFGSQAMCGFRITADELDSLRTLEDVKSMLIPDRVALAQQKHGYDIVEKSSGFHNFTPGNSIIRHGEWFLIPGEFQDLSMYDIEKPLQAAKRRAFGGKETIRRMFTDKQLGSHVPRDKVVIEDGRIFVRGSFRHLRREHAYINLGEIWHEAATHGRDVMVFDTSNGRGSGGWD